jgi:hypothetical protein
MLANYQDKIVEYYQFDLNILSVFGIEEEKQLKKISDKLLEAFSR